VGQDAYSVPVRDYYAANPHLSDHSTAGLPRIPSRAAYMVRRQAQNRRRTWVALLVIMALVVGVATLAWYSFAGQYTTSPVMDGMDEPRALDTGREAGLQVQFEYVPHELIPAGRWVASNPSVGSRIRRGTVVKVSLSTGPERFTMPNIVGMNRADAIKALQLVFATPGQVGEAFDEKIRAGVVIKSAVKAGTKIKRETAVDFTVSKGRQPIKFDSWVNQPATTAIAALTKSGFRVVKTEQFHETVGLGRVISQDPGSGSKFRGDTIKLVVSLGRPFVVVPTVARLSVKEATQRLTALGLITRTKKAAIGNFLNLGIVWTSNPQAGARLRKGSTVVLTYL